jgi:hypothetical protein
MEELVENSKALNILVPKLIDKTKYLQKEFKKRMKLNKIFAEFENRASIQFNYFIKNSNKRYNHTKYGNDLDSFITNNRKKDINEANKIINDKFYSDISIQKEKEKLKYKSTSKIYKDIKHTINEIQLPLKKDFNKNSKRKLQLIINGIISNKNSKKKKIIKRQKKIIRKSDIEANKKIINEELIKDQESMNNSISKYLKKVNNPSRNIQDLFISPSEILSSTSYKKRPDIDLPFIKLINYSNHKNNKILIKEKSLSDINKLIPYSKVGKYLSGNNSNKELSFNNLDNNKKPFITETNVRIIKINDYSNTANIVYSSAHKEYRSQSNFDKKRRIINDLFGFDKIPQLNTYDDILFKKSENLKKERHIKAKKIFNRQKYSNLVGQEKINAIINDEIKVIDKIKKNIYKKINMYNNGKKKENN